MTPADCQPPPFPPACSQGFRVGWDAKRALESFGEMCRLTTEVRTLHTGVKREHVTRASVCLCDGGKQLRACSLGHQEKDGGSVRDGESLRAIKEEVR